MTGTHGIGCDCAFCRQGAYPAFSPPVIAPLPYYPPPGDMAGPPPAKFADMIDKKARRERIATAAMQGLLAGEPHDDATPFAQLAQDAVEMADALITELDKENE